MKGISATNSVLYGFYNDKQRFTDNLIFSLFGFSFPFFFFFILCVFPIACLYTGAINFLPPENTSDMDHTLFRTLMISSILSVIVSSFLLGLYLFVRNLITYREENVYRIVFCVPYLFRYDSILNRRTSLFLWLLFLVPCPLFGFLYIYNGSLIYYWISYLSGVCLLFVRSLLILIGVKD